MAIHRGIFIRQYSPALGNNTELDHAERHSIAGYWSCIFIIK